MNTFTMLLWLILGFFVFYLVSSAIVNVYDSYKNKKSYSDPDTECPDFK